MGLVKGIDRNIKVSETAEMVTDIILYLSLVHGWEIRDLVRKMYRGCPTCRRLGNKFESPKVIR
jgi:4-hydroxy-3-methylbut-2-en-1-yl diphosphate synthase IspG/GcpE